MSNTLWLVGGVALGAFAYYCYQRGKSLEKEHTPEEYLNASISGTCEKVESLSLNDIISYFKGLNLRKGKDIPFIADINKCRDMLGNISFTSQYGFVIASYNEDMGKLENCKFLETDVVAPDLLNVMGNEKLVVLS